MRRMAESWGDLPPIAAPTFAKAPTCVARFRCVRLQRPYDFSERTRPQRRAVPCELDAACNPPTQRVLHSGSAHCHKMVVPTSKPPGSQHPARESIPRVPRANSGTLSPRVLLDVLHGFEHAEVQRGVRVVGHAGGCSGPANPQRPRPHSGYRRAPLVATTRRRECGLTPRED